MPNLFPIRERGEGREDSVRGFGDAFHILRGISAGIREQLDGVGPYRPGPFARGR